MSFEKQNATVKAPHANSRKDSQGSEAGGLSRLETGLGLEQPALSKAAKIVLVGTLACAGFLNIASVQSSVILLPQISSDLHIPVSRQQWVTSAYNIALGCALMFWGRVADIYGRRRIFLGGMAFMTVVTITIPFSSNEIVFDILRALQGLGASATTPSAVGILGATLAAGKEKNYGFITYTAASSLGSILGNILGGIIGSFLTWKWMFWITAIIAASVGFTAFFVIPRSQPSPNGPCKKVGRNLDLLGAFLITTSLVLLLFVLSEGNTVGWQTPWIPVLLILSVFIIIAFGFWQRHLEAGQACVPLVRMSLFRSKQFAAAFAIIMAYFSSFNSYLVFATFFYQDYQGLSSLETTLRFLPAGVGGLLICFVTARLMHVTPGFYLLVFASTCGIISPLLFAIPIPPSTTYWAYGFPAMCLCISTDVFAPTINLFVVRQLPQRDQAIGGAMIQTSNQLGRALGLAISTAVETSIVGTHDHIRDPLLLRGIRAGEWVNVGMACSSLLIILLAFRDLKAAGASITKS